MRFFYDDDDDRITFKLTKREWEQLTAELEKEPEPVPGLVELFERGRKLKQQDLGESKYLKGMDSSFDEVVSTMHRSVQMADYNLGVREERKRVLELWELEMKECDCEVAMHHLKERIEGEENAV